MAPRYRKSATAVPGEMIAFLGERRCIEATCAPDRDETLYHIRKQGLEAIIGLRIEYHRSGSAKSCSYFDGNGTVLVPSAEAWKCWAHDAYIKDGAVYCNWEPRGRNLAEVIAATLAKGDAREAILHRQRHPEAAPGWR